MYINNITTSYNDIVFEDCTIENCHADNGYGGFLYVNDGDAQPVFNRTTITNCKAKRGGVEYIQSSNYPSQFNDCVVTDCQASELGGFVYTNDAEAVVECSNTMISECSAVDGGVYISKGTLAEDLVLADNTATYAGGGMHNNSEIDAQCTVRNCRFIHNTAGDNDKNLQSGGGLYVDDGNGYVIGCKFFENLAYKTVPIFIPIRTFRTVRLSQKVVAELFPLSLMRSKSRT